MNRTTFEFLAKTFDLGCRNAIYVSKCIDRVVTIEFNVTRETFWWKSYYWDIFIFCFSLWLLMKNFWQICRNCFLRAQGTGLSKTIFRETVTSSFKFRYLRKFFIQVCQMSIPIARRLYFSEVFLTEKPLPLHFCSNFWAKVFPLLAQKVQQVCQTAFYLFRKTFWGKLLPARRLHLKVLARFGESTWACSEWLLICASIWTTFSKLQVTCIEIRFQELHVLRIFFNFVCFWIFDVFFLASLPKLRFSCEGKHFEKKLFLENIVGSYIKFGIGKKISSKKSFSNENPKFSQFNSGLSAKDFRLLTWKFQQGG